MRSVIKQLFPRAARLGWRRRGLTVETRAGMPGAPRQGAAGKTPAQLLRDWLWAHPATVWCWAAEEPTGAGWWGRACTCEPRARGYIDAIVFIYLKYLAVSEGAEECKIVFA